MKKSKSTEPPEIGRPKKEPDILPDGWGKEALSLYEEGAGDVEIKALIYKKLGRFSNDLWDRWLLESKEFSEIIGAGRLLSQAWWERMGRKNLHDHIDKGSGSKFNDRLWFRNMQNRFRSSWKDNWDKFDAKGELIPEAEPVTIVLNGVEIPMGTATRPNQA
jgi:hypothetical protein